MFKTLAIATALNAFIAPVPAFAEDLLLVETAYAAFWAEEVANTCYGFDLVTDATVDNRALSSMILWETAADFLGEDRTSEIWFNAYNAAQVDVAGGDAERFLEACAYVNL